MESDPLALAQAARLHSRNTFLDAVDMGAEVRRVTESLQERIKRNHFGEGLERAMMKWNRNRGNA